MKTFNIHMERHDDFDVRANSYDEALELVKQLGCDYIGTNGLPLSNDRPEEPMFWAGTYVTFSGVADNTEAHEDLRG